MLAKVMKHEAKAVGRLVLPLFLVALALGGFSRLLALLAQLVWQPAGLFFNTVGSFLGVFLFIGVVGLVCVYVVLRFWRSMLGAESPLTFSLPVKAGTQVWGRFIVHTLYILLGFCVGIACLFVTIPGLAGGIMQTPLHMNYFGKSGSFMLGDIPANTMNSYLLFAVACILLAIVSNLSKFYASFAIGSQMRERLVGSVLGYIILSVVEGLLILPALLVPVFSIGRNLDEFFVYSQNIQTITGTDIVDFIWLMLGGIGVYCLLCTAAHFVITHICFGKRLNVE